MRKTKRPLALLLMLALSVAFTGMLGACNKEKEHVCAHVCPTCHKCTDLDCTDEVCKEKCAGHTTPEEPEEPFEGTLFGVEVGHAGTSADPLPVSDALKIAAKQDYQKGVTEKKVYVKGVVSSVDTSTGHFNFYIDEGTDSIYCYGLYNRENKEYGTADGLLGLNGTPQKNDTVVLYSNISNYFGTYELTNSELVSVTEGVHEEQTQTSFNPHELTWITDKSALTDGTYLVGGYWNSNYDLMGHSLSSTKIVGTEITAEVTSLNLEDYTYYIHVVGNKISLKNTSNNKYVGYTGNSTNLEWSNEEVFWELSDGDLEANAPIRAIYEGTSRKLQSRPKDGQFGAYSDNKQSSDLTFAKVD